MQLAPFLAYLTHKLSFSVHSYPLVLAARDHSALVSWHRCTDLMSVFCWRVVRRRGSAVPTELPSPPAGSQTWKPWL